EIAVARFQSWMTPGSHHFILYATQQAARPDGTFEDCTNRGGGLNPATVGVWVYAAQDPQSQLEPPAGVALPLRARQLVYFNMLYVNTTSEPRTVRVWLNLEYATGNFQRAGAFVTFNTQIAIPPGGRQTVAGDCDVPSGVNFFSMTTHSHRYTLEA